MATKILYLITKSNWGGAQRYVFDLATNLPKDESEVVVALGGSGVLVDKLNEAGIRVISIPSLERDLSLSKEWRSTRELWHIIQEEKPNVLHLNSSKAGVLGALIGRLAGIPKIIFTAHGWAFNENRPYWQRLFAKAVHWITVLLSHQTIAVSNEVKRQMDWPFVQEKIVVVHNGRTISNFLERESARAFLSNIEPRLKNYIKDFWSITIAELHPIKRHDAVIDSLKDLVAIEPNTRHIIIGTGEEEEYLQNKIKELDLTEHVFLLGAITEAAQYLKAADIFILASRSEAMAYVIIEAAAASLPIVATRVGGIPEIIDHGKNGLLVPPLDNIALFKAILLLNQNSELRNQLGNEAFARSSQFTLERMLEKTIGVYHN